MRRKVYLIDMENISSNVLVRQSIINKKDVVYLLCSRERKINVDNLESFKEKKWHIVEVVTKTQANSLDFQLSSLAGAILASNDDLDIYIMSKDKGYDSVVRFFTLTAEGKLIRGSNTIRRYDNFGVLKNTCIENNVKLTGRREVQKKCKVKQEL